MRFSSAERELLKQTHDALLAHGANEVGLLAFQRMHQRADDRLRDILDRMRPAMKQAMFDFVVSEALFTANFHTMSPHASHNCGKGVVPADFDVLREAVMSACRETLGDAVWTPAVADAYQRSFTRAANWLMGAIDDLEPGFMPEPSLPPKSPSPVADIASPLKLPVMHSLPRKHSRVNFCPATTVSATPTESE